MEISQLRPEGIEGANKSAGLKKLTGENNSGASFKDTMGGFVDDVNNMQVKADTAIEDFATGKAENIHEVMISMQKAEMSFKFLMQTRNKLVDAYKEVMRLQV